MRLIRRTEIFRRKGIFQAAVVKLSRRIRKPSGGHQRGFAAVVQVRSVTAVREIRQRDVRQQPLNTVVLVHCNPFKILRRNGRMPFKGVPVHIVIVMGQRFPRATVLILGFKYDDKRLLIMLVGTVDADERLKKALHQRGFSASVLPHNRGNALDIAGGQVRVGRENIRSALPVFVHAEGIFVPFAFHLKTELRREVHALVGVLMLRVVIEKKPRSHSYLPLSTESYHAFPSIARGGRRGMR